IQACGRVVRSPEDYGATYLADDSLLDLFDRAKTDMPGWFEDQVDRLSTPNLPETDPDAALSGIDAYSGRRSQPTRSQRGSGSSGSAGGSSTTESTAGDAGDESPSNRTEADAAKRENHPLSDVWGDG
ncbi:MAG: helicase C-terminal domain-containing protein, partial [Halolamina sp.]